jgi:hypothetical protein
MAQKPCRGISGLRTYLRTSKMNAFLRWIPESEFDLDLAQLADADIVLPEPGDPLAMVNRHVQILKQMDDARIILLLTGLHAMKALHKRLTQADAQSEVVVIPEVAEMFQSNSDYVELVEGMIDTGRFEVYMHGDGGADEDGEPSIDATPAAKRLILPQVQMLDTSVRPAEPSLGHSLRSAHSVLNIHSSASISRADESLRPALEAI